MPSPSPSRLKHQSVELKPLPPLPPLPGEIERAQRRYSTCTSRYSVQCAPIHIVDCLIDDSLSRRAVKEEARTARHKESRKTFEFYMSSVAPNLNHQQRQGQFKSPLQIPGPCTVAQQAREDMALSETTFDPSTADLIKLRKILEACIYVPDIGDASRQPGLSREQRFCLALDRFESTARVFDQSYYESQVLRIGTTEDELDDRLRREARDVGVPESHYPSTKRRRVHRLSKQQIPVRQYVNFDFPSDRRMSAISMDPSRAVSHNSGVMSPPPIRNSASSRPSMHSTMSERLPNRQSGSLSLQPTPAASVVSFKTTSSQSSSFSDRIFGKRRDSRHSIRQFFRRDSSREIVLVTDDQNSAAESTAPSVGANQHAIAEEPDSISPRSHESQDLSSIQSLSISSRTSMSSLGEQQPLQDISAIDRPSIERFVQSRSFMQLRASCEEEMQRFNAFATDQHVALPLILGRNHLYNQERREARLAELQREHEAEIEKMDDRQAEKELVLQEMLRAAMDDNAVRNATAVKHVTSRIALLGDEALPEHHHRLEEEQTALKRLARKHEVEMRNLVRYQESKKLELLRKQEKAYEDLSKSLETDLETKRKDKTTKLQHNISRLDDLVEERRIKLVARWFLRLQLLRVMSNETANMDAALPLSLLGLSPAFTSALGYS